jgi:hypothetical protein
MNHPELEQRLLEMMRRNLDSLQLEILAEMNNLIETRKYPAPRRDYELAMCSKAPCLRRIG